MTKSPFITSTLRLASIVRTKKYMAIICKDRWGSSYFSPAGESSCIDRKETSPVWIGETLKEALFSSQDFFVKLGGYPLPLDKLEAAKIESAACNHAFWCGIAERFRFKDTRAARSKSALVFVSWSSDKTDQVKLLASRGSGTSHSAWYEGENDGKVFHVSINASDEEMGEVAVRALDACRPNYA